MTVNGKKEIKIEQEYFIGMKYESECKQGKKEGKEYFIKMIVINVMLNDKIEVKEILL